jgi:hypothetical protein
VFEPMPPRVYVAKVKNALVGLAPTDEEVRAVAADPAALGPLVDAWMKLPEYRQKMLRFFQLAFQQTQITPNDFLGQVYAQIGHNPTTTPRLMHNLEESFARTMLALIDEGRPITLAFATRRLMMTTALKEFYAFLDAVEIDDNGNIFDRFRFENRSLAIVVEASQGPIPVAETLDPASPNFMRWYDPDVAIANADYPGCQHDPTTLGPVAITLHYLLLGTIDSHKLADGSLCPRFAGSPDAPQLKTADFEDWTMVTLREPASGERTTPFYDLATLRSAHDLVLGVPRVGFFSTPAFFANWPTNSSNQMRATMHQALIVATGSAIDGTDPTAAPGAPGLDTAHATDGACIGCHRTLDPTRSIFSATWSWSYRRQQDPTWTSEPGRFAFRGVVAPVASITDFGAALAAHPLVAPGWIERLCYYVNSAPCKEDDPEFVRVVDLFRSSDHSWNAAVRALVTSPLTTYASETRTTSGDGAVVAVARRDHLCAALGARLGLLDPCQLGAPAMSSELPMIVSGLPSDGYGRGAVAPVLPNEPTLFFRAGIENICEDIAADVVDSASAGAGAASWSSADPESAISDFVNRLMALAPSDPRYEPARALLEDHFQSAVAEAGVTATDALRSTFVVACAAPSTVSMGL